MTGSTAEVIWLLAWFLLIAVAFMRSMRRVNASRAAARANDVAHGQPSSSVQGWHAPPFALSGIMLAGAATGATPLREFVESPNALDGTLFIVAALFCLVALLSLWRYRL